MEELLDELLFAVLCSKLDSISIQSPRIFQPVDPEARV